MTDVLPQRAASLTRPGCGVLLGGIGCLLMGGLAALLVGTLIVNQMQRRPEERAAATAEARAAAREEAARGRADALALARVFARMADQLPSASSLRTETPCPLSVDLELGLTPASPEFFLQFDESGYLAQNHRALAWFAAPELEGARQLLKAVRDGESVSPDRVRAVTLPLERKRYFGVLYPVRSQPPLLKDANTFAGGVLDGWLVLATVDTGTPLCQVKVRATSSPEVSEKYVKWAGLKFGHDMQEALDADFRNNLMATARESLSRAQSARR